MEPRNETSTSSHASGHAPLGVPDDRPGVAVWRVSHAAVTQRFVGYGSVLRPDIVALHPQAAGAVVALAADAPVRLRVRLADGSGVDVIDGDALVSHNPATAGLVAVNLDFATRCRVTVPALPLRPTPRDVAALVQHLADAAASDPATPPPAPHRTGHTKPGADPGLAPPWCSIWPSAWGCG